MSGHKSGVAVPFYECRRKTAEEVIDPCDRELHDWLVAVLAAYPSAPAWVPQRKALADILARVNDAIANDYQQCLLRGRSESPEEAGAKLRVLLSTALKNGRTVTSRSGNGKVMTASLGVSFGQGQACQPIPFHLTHDAAVSHTINPLSLFVQPMNAFPPIINGSSPHYEGAFVVPYGSFNNWNPELFQAATGFFEVEGPAALSFGIAATKIENPPQPAAIEQRTEPADPSLIEIQISASFPSVHIKVLSRFTHVQSGRQIFFEYWVEKNDGPVWQKRTATTYDLTKQVVSSNFSIPFDPDWDDPFFRPEGFDPDGEWLHEVGIRNFVIPATNGRITYGGEDWAAFSMATGQFTEWPLNDPEVSPWLGAVWSGTFTLRTVGSKKAALRIVGVQTIAGVGILLRVKLRNEFHFPACIRAAVPLLIGSMLVANLQPGTESSEISVLVPISDLTGGNRIYGFQEHLTHGAAEENALPNGVFRTTAMPALTMATGSLVSDARSIFDQSGKRITTPGAEVFSYTLAETVAPVDNWISFSARFAVSGEVSDGNGGWIPFGPNQVTVTMPASEAKALIGKVAGVKVSSARTIPGSVVVFTEWDGNVDNKEFEQALIASHPYQTDPNRRNLTFQVTSPAEIRVDRNNVIAEGDYPGTYPDSLPSVSQNAIVVRNNHPDPSRIDILLGDS